MENKKGRNKKINLKDGRRERQEKKSKKEQGRMAEGSVDAATQTSFCETAMLLLT